MIVFNNKESKFILEALEKVSVPNFLYDVKLYLNRFSVDLLKEIFEFSKFKAFEKYYFYLFSLLEKAFYFHYQDFKYLENEYEKILSQVEEITFSLFDLARI